MRGKDLFVLDKKGGMMRKYIILLLTSLTAFSMPKWGVEVGVEGGIGKFNNGFYKTNFQILLHGQFYYYFSKLGIGIIDRGYSSFSPGHNIFLSLLYTPLSYPIPTQEYGAISLNFFIEGGNGNTFDNGSAYPIHINSPKFLTGGFEYQINPYCIPFYIKGGISKMWGGYDSTGVYYIGSISTTSYFLSLGLSLGLYGYRYNLPKLRPYLNFIDGNGNRVLQPGESGIIEVKLRDRDRKNPAKDLDIDVSIIPSSFKNYLTFPSIFPVRSFFYWNDKTVSIPISTSGDIPSKRVKVILTGYDRNRKHKLFRKEMEITVGKVGEITKKKTFTGQDLYPPVLYLISPENGASVSSTRIEIKGIAYDETGIKEIKVNGLPVSKKRGVSIIPAHSIGLPYTARDTTSFIASISLNPGENIISVVAIDKTGKQTRKTITVRAKYGIPKSLPALYAVVVGISDYADPRVRDLKYSDEDAISFFNFLKSQKEKNVFRDVHIRYLLNKEASLKEVRSALSDLIDASEDDIVLFYFAGHGITDKGGDPYLLTYDSNIDELYATALPMEEINSLLKRKIFSKRALIIADACHSGGIATNIRGSDVYSRFYTLLKDTKGKAILTASRPQEYSEEKPSLRHGVFTYYLIQGLRGEADGDRIITLNELYDYVYDKVKGTTRGAQHPYLGGNPAGDMPVGVR